jgi:hypothetical protein
MFTQMKKITVVIIAFLALNSCSTNAKSYTARNQNINRGEIIQNPLLADLEVKGERVTGIATGKSIYRETVKQEAVANELKGMKSQY